MNATTLALFGEAEKGEFQVPYFCKSLEQLVEYLGNPPPESRGLYYAVQALLYQRDLFFFRVKEEGFSQSDYLCGFQFLKKRELMKEITALCLPGVGDGEIIHATDSLCEPYHTILIMTESDLYDYLLRG